MSNTLGVEGKMFSSDGVDPVKLAYRSLIKALNLYELLGAKYVGDRTDARWDEAHEAIDLVLDQLTGWDTASEWRLGAPEPGKKVPHRHGTEML